jgi:hypothetical protein
MKQQIAQFANTVMIGPLERIAVEIIFDTVDALNRALPGLIESDFETLHLDDQAVDEPPTAWLLVWTITRDEPDRVMDCVNALVTPCGGMVWEWGIVSDEELKAWIRHDDLFAEMRKLS